MITLGGGTVRYRDLGLLPCPDQPRAVGACERAGALDVLWRDRVVETFTVAAGDYVLVADGAVAAPGTQLVETTLQRTVRAAIPAEVEAIAEWSDTIVDYADDVTGLSTARFAIGAPPVRLTLRRRSDEVCLACYELDRRIAIPAIRSGAIVRRGDVLARVTDRVHSTTFAALRSLLDARLAVPGFGALVAPCDGTVEEVDDSYVRLRATDGRRLQLRLHHGRVLDALRARGDLGVLAYPGQVVCAGDRLTEGERSHHALLHAWGEDRLGDHLLDELQALLGPSLPRPYLALAVRALLAWRRVDQAGATGLTAGSIVPRAEFERANRAARARGAATATAHPALRGAAAIAHAGR
jgi:hypothetical protein